jgi:hypothetical protein
MLLSIDHQTSVSTKYFLDMILIKITLNIYGKLFWLRQQQSLLFVNVYVSYLHETEPISLINNVAGYG